MIIDSRYHKIRTDVEFDICIIGAGAAGITAALELARNTSLSMVLLEAGGERFAHEAQSLFQGEVEGDRHPPLWRSLFSGLGGSTQVWAGWCRPLEERDFEQRDYIANSGWPIRSDELQAAYRRANEICGLGSRDYELETWRDVLPGKPLSSAPELLHHIFQIRKLRFNRSYHADLQKAENIYLYLHSPVMRLHTKQDGGRVHYAEVASYNGKTTLLGAKQFILACGGIENARLLLLSASSPANAPGNRNDCVGRYFIDHGFIDSGWFLPAADTRDLRYYFSVPHPQNPGQAGVRPVITLPPEVLEKERMLNAAMYFYPSYESHPVFASDAVKAALELWEILKGKKISELLEISKADPALGDLMDFCRRICSCPHYVLQALLRKALVKGTSCSRWRTRFYYECAPLADNRVVLSEEKDRFGRRRAQLRWHLSEQDLDSAYRFHVYLDDVLQKNGAGRLLFFNELSQWRSNTVTGMHPAGTTRMHDDPKQGVVDKNCRVHGVENLYIAGSSVCPTAGYANPTLTIVALAIRLAGHLSRL